MLHLIAAKFPSGKENKKDIGILKQRFMFRRFRSFESSSIFGKVSLLIKWVSGKLRFWGFVLIYLWWNFCYSWEHTI